MKLLKRLAELAAEDGCLMTPAKVEEGIRAGFRKAAKRHGGDASAIDGFDGEQLAQILVAIEESNHPLKAWGRMADSMGCRYWFVYRDRNDREVYPHYVRPGDSPEVELNRLLLQGHEIIRFHHPAAEEWSFE